MNARDRWDLMAKDRRAREARLAKKRLKARARKQARAGRSAPADALQHVKRAVREAQGCPVHECMISRGWEELGLVTILIARRQTNGRIAFGVFLVDVYCLGLKNTFCNGDFTVLEYGSQVRDKLVREYDLLACPLDLAHGLIYGGIEYAKQFGFKPNRDFKMSQYLLDPRESVTLRDDLSFGKDGRPFYISGPEDNVERIVRQLEATAGEGNFDCTFEG